MPHLKSRILSLIFSLALPVAALADYEVELIVFERPSIAASSEGKPLPPLEPYQQPENARTLPLTFPLAALADLPPKLTAQGYKVLAKWRWQQPANTFIAAPLYRLPVPGLAESYVRIYRTTPIFADLTLAIPGTLPTVTHDGQHTLISAPTPTPVINEKRRVRFRQIHYFDHPRFGALLLVNQIRG